MGVVVGPAAQAPTNVEQGKEIATLMPTVVAIWNVVKVMEMMTTVILPWDFLLIMIAVMILNVLMEVEEQPVAQALTNVEKGKGIVTLILNALEVWNVARAMVLMTTVDQVSLKTMTAVMIQQK